MPRSHASADFGSLPVYKCCQRQTLQLLYHTCVKMGIKRREKLRMACDGNGSRETSYRRGRSFEMNMIGKIHGIVWGPWTPVLCFIRSDSCVDASASIPDISPFASKSDTGCPSMLRMLFRLTTKSVHKFPGLRYIKPNGLIIYLHHHFLHGSSFRCRNMALAVCLYLRHSSE